MNRLEIAQHICSLLDMPEQEDIDACGDFLEQQAKLLWGRALWKDSHAWFTSTLSSTGAGMTTALWLPSRATFVCPAMVDRVLACRLEGRHLNVEDVQSYFRYDTEEFEASGTPTDFHLLSPCVYEFDEAVTFNAFADEEGADEGAVITFDYLSTDNFTVIRGTDSMVAGGSPNFFTTLRIDSFAKPVTNTRISLEDVNDNNNLFLIVAAGDTMAPLRQRIRLVRIPDPTTTITLRVLVKVVMPSFSEDSDQPPIRGCEDVLIALGSACMYERDRQMGKRQAARQEAEQHYGNLFKLETVQQAHNKRIMPEEGYGPDWDVNSLMDVKV